MDEKRLSQVGSEMCMSDSSFMRDGALSGSPAACQAMLNLQLRSRVGPSGGGQRLKLQQPVRFHLLQQRQRLWQPGPLPLP